MSAYPKMIYGPDGSTHVLASADAPRPEGDWSDTPSDAHRAGKPDHFFSTRIDPEEERRGNASRMADEIAELVIAKLKARGALPAEAGESEDEEDPEEPRRGPGRPRKNP